MANRVGVGVGVGTEGIGFDVAVPLTKYVQARVGLNVIPKNRLGIRFELGAQFQGKPVVYADDVGDVLKKMDQAHRTTSLSLWTIYRFIQC